MHYNYYSLSAIHKGLEKKRKPAAPNCRAMAKGIWNEHFSKGLQESRKLHYSSAHREELESKLVMLEQLMKLEKQPLEKFISARTMHGLAGIVAGVLLNGPLSDIAASAYMALAKGPLPMLESVLKDPGCNAIISTCVLNAGLAASFIFAAYGRAGFIMDSEFSKINLFVKSARSFSQECWRDSFKAQAKE